KTCIEIDTQKIVRVLDNLFTNAVKYSLKENEDGIENKQQIKLKARCNTETNELIISVIDNGPGIPEKNLPFVFMRTYMVSAARTPENGKTGSGLGLSIAKTIIEKHNGSIECISEINKWTEFIIRLPMCVK
ncbi:MAG: GHKL domain-containing protein, partial [Lachnospiraceae bacterium]|nr:GHKL domain-containing protein [Lachnospiraceae bacterium]